MCILFVKIKTILYKKKKKILKKFLNPNLSFDFSTRSFKRKIIDVDNIFYIAVQIVQM